MVSPVAFKKMMLEKFNAIVNCKQRDIDEMWKEGLDTCTIIFDPEDASRHGQFENMLDNFFAHSRPARNRDEIIKGNSFIEDARIHFRSEDLFRYLSIMRFQHTHHEVWSWLSQIGAATKQIKVKGKMLRVWTLPEPTRYDATPIAVPSMDEEL
jgi:hypothetical protein